MPELSQIAAFTLAPFILGLTPRCDIIHGIVRGAGRARTGMVATVGAIMLALGLRLIYEKAP